MTTGTQEPSTGGGHARPRPDEHASIATLVIRLSEQITRLVKAEIALAIDELSTRAKRTGLGVGLFAAAAGVGFFAFAALIATAILGLATVVPAWAAGLIVSGVLVAITAALAVIGRQQVAAGRSTSSNLVENLKSDVEAVRKGVQP